MPENRPAGYPRRRLLRDTAVGAAAVSTAGLVAGTPAQAAPSAPPARRHRAGAVSFRWWGTAGWRIDIGNRTVLVDPYLSRFDTGLFRGAFHPDTALTVAADVVDRLADRAENILVTHTHWDHFNDVPHIAARTGARVLGTLTAYHLGVAYGLPTGQLAPVKGGEVLDFDGYTIEVVGSLHSRNAAFSMAFPGVRVSPPPQPTKVSDLPEGDTLAYQIRVDGGPSVFFMGRQRPGRAPIRRPGSGRGDDRLRRHRVRGRLRAPADGGAGPPEDRGAGALGQLRDPAGQPADGRPDRPGPTRRADRRGAPGLAAQPRGGARVPHRVPVLTGRAQPAVRSRSASTDFQLRAVATTPNVFSRYAVVNFVRP